MCLAPIGYTVSADSLLVSEHDLQSRPIYHYTRPSIDAHLTIVLTALVVSHWVEYQTRWSIKKFVCTARGYRTIHIRAADKHSQHRHDQATTACTDVAGVV
jgi:hypothetical protein